MKVIAFYLPQFHNIPLNNELWGEGFTEWTNVKKGKPLFDGHEQPVVPLNENYYDLLDENVMRWQINLAKEYGVYGFCFYHYWYNGQLIMEKPILNFLKDDSLDLPFCICWANHQWTTSWTEGEVKVILEQNYSDRSDWIKHFEFLLPFLKDKRYIYKDGKPLLVLYEIANIPKINDMLKCWQQMAKENDLPGLTIAFESSMADTIPGYRNKYVQYDIEYQPQYARVFQNHKRGIKVKVLGLLRKINWKTLKIRLPKKLSENFSNLETKLTIYDYDNIWKNIIQSKPFSKKSIPGAFIKMDTTPRRAKRGFVIHGYTPEKFGNYMKEQIVHAKNQYHQDMIFLFAWNEWAEGGYMEPDQKWGYKALESLKRALSETGEFPEYP